MCRLNVGLLECAIKHWQDCGIRVESWGGVGHLSSCPVFSEQWWEQNRGQSTPPVNSSSPHFYLSFNSKSQGGEGSGSVHVCVCAWECVRVEGTYCEIWPCHQSDPIRNETSFSFFHAPCTTDKKIEIWQLIGVWACAIYKCILQRGENARS